MQGLSERQYASHAGISRGAVQKARAAGRLVLLPDGSIDAAASDARRLAATDPAKQRGGKPAAVRPVAAAAVGSVRETLEEQGLPAGSRVTYVEARTAHEIAKAHLARLKLQERKGELVDRARATALVFRLAREERDAWLNWPARVAALMAAELGGRDPHAWHHEPDRAYRIRDRQQGSVLRRRGNRAGSAILRGGTGREVNGNIREWQRRQGAPQGPARAAAVLLPARADHGRGV